MNIEQKVDKLKKAFERITRSQGVSIFFKVTPAPIGSWIAIEFEPLNVDEMEAACHFIRHYYTPTKEKPYRNRCVKFGTSQGGYPALIIDGSGDFEEIFT